MWLRLTVWLHGGASAVSRWAKIGVVAVLVVELLAVVLVWGPGRSWWSTAVSEAGTHRLVARGQLQQSENGSAVRADPVSFTAGPDRWVLGVLATQQRVGYGLGSGAGSVTNGGDQPADGSAPAASGEVVRVTVAAAGDFLMHMPIVDCAKTASDYEFNPIFLPVQRYLESAHFAVVNLETRLAGADFGYSGYPRFNTPAELARDIGEMGVDLVATANNHSMDMGAKGVFRTLENLDAAGMPHVGTARSAEEQASVPIFEVEGVQIAFLNATSSLNGIPLPEDHPFAVTMIDSTLLLTQAATARGRGADVVIAVLHWGEEYSRESSEGQREVAHRLLNGGIDVIIGSHPHVVEPIQRLTVERDGRPFTTYVAYSLGNFVSNQRDRYRDSGIVLFVDIEKGHEGVSVTGVRFLPVWVQKTPVNGMSHYRVLPIHPAIDPQSDLTLTSADRRRMDQVWQELTEMLANPDRGITIYQP